MVCLVFRERRARRPANWQAGRLPLRSVSSCEARGVHLLAVRPKIAVPAERAGGTWNNTTDRNTRRAFGQDGRNTAREAARGPPTQCVGKPQKAARRRGVRAGKLVAGTRVVGAFGPGPTETTAGASDGMRARRRAFEGSGAATTRFHFHASRAKRLAEREPKFHRALRAIFVREEVERTPVVGVEPW